VLYTTSVFSTLFLTDTQQVSASYTTTFACVGPHIGWTADF